MAYANNWENCGQSRFSEKWEQRKNCSYSEFYWFIFFHIQIKYGEIRSIFPYSFRMRKNMEQRNSKYRHFSPSEVFREFQNITKFQNWYYETWKAPSKFSKKFSKTSIEPFSKTWILNNMQISKVKSTIDSSELISISINKILFSEFKTLRVSGPST